MSKEYDRFQKSMNKESRSRKCKSKNPTYCRYHGVPQPVSLTTLTNKFDRLNAAIITSHKNLNTEETRILEKERIETGLKIAGIKAVNDLTDAEEFLSQNKLEYNRFYPVNLKKLRAERLHEVDNYQQELINKVFTTEEEKYIAKKGSLKDSAWRLARKNNYPRASFGVSDYGVPSEEREYISSKGKEYIRKHTLEDVTEYAKQNNLEVVRVQTGVLTDAYVPFSWDSYGMSKETYEQTLTDEFKDRYVSYRTAVRSAKSGEQISVLASQVEPKLLY